MVWQRIQKRLFGARTQASAEPDKAVVKAFRKRYARFRKLLDANTALADLMADMEVKLSGSSLFGSLYVHNSAQRAVALAKRMAQSLDEMHPGRHAGLPRAVLRIQDQLLELTGHTTLPDTDVKSMTIPLSEIDASMVDWVGGKSANLGEISTMVGLPVPRGFAITVRAFEAFMEYGGLGTTVEGVLGKLDPENRDSMTEILRGLRATIESAPLPPELEQDLHKAIQGNFGSEDVRLAVRSSAQAEDGSKSFAGQFLSELNVRRADIAASYKRVVASLFTPSATLYRLHQGIPLRASAMSVVCLEMVFARSSGIAYSHDPINLLQDTLLINGVWGLGRYAVDGVVEPDYWVFTRNDKPELVRRRLGAQYRMLALDESGELRDQLVPWEEQYTYCLPDDEAAELAGMVMRLEQHYGTYQDVEWAKTQDGRLIILQSRPLDTQFGSANMPTPPLMENYPLLLSGGDVAYPGVGCGPVVIVKSTDDLLHFPVGGVLVALHSNAEYAAVMDKVQAVLTQTGGVTGHMATICREYRVPSILNVPRLMNTLTPGKKVTVDAFSCRVYEGTVEELLPLRLDIEPVRLQDTPVYSMLHEVSRLILPLNLTDPASAKFSPEHCKTLHDVMRYAHELSYQEMFAISDSAVDAGSVALKLKAPLPIDLHLIDLDKGTDVPPGSHWVTPEQITSAPLRALLNGMLRPEVVFRKPRPINLGGFVSVMGQQMGNPQGGDGRFGDKSYAIISDRYMNFSSRVGYHYSVLDAYCGQTQAKNYISFSFQGGAAGEGRRIRRIKAIALVLQELGFTLDIQGDMVKSRFQKYPKEDIEERLDLLGRLLQVTRQMDMLMTDDSAIAAFKDDFMNGIYR